MQTPGMGLLSRKDDSGSGLNWGRGGEILNFMGAENWALGKTGNSKCLGPLNPSLLPTGESVAQGDSRCTSHPCLSLHPPPFQEQG